MYMEYTKEYVLNKLKAFNDDKFIFEQKTHQYTYDNNVMHGCTTFLNKFIKAFDEKYWSKKKADERDITQEEILAEWKEKRDRSTYLGTLVHDYIENFYEKDSTKLTEDDEANERIKKWHKIYDKRLNVLESVASEIKVFSKKYNLAGTIDKLYLHDGKLIIGDWKGLPLDTPILTTTGWKNMIDLKVGDYVFDTDGKHARILHKSKIHNKKCIKLQFDNMEEITSDFEHRWYVRIGNNKKHTVMTTQEIFDYLKKYDNKPPSYKTIRIDNPTPIINDDVELPLDPYVLGMWLGDGNTADNKITQMNESVWKEIEKRGYSLGNDVSGGGAGKAQVRTIFETQHILNKLNKLNNKHIPEIYLLSSYKQRLDLLRGFMDADGYYNKTRKRYGTASTRHYQIMYVVKLLATLGIKSTVNTYIKKLNGKKIRCWSVDFTTDEFNPFLCRNQDIVVKTNKQHKYRRISNAEVVETVPTVCIEVDSLTNTFLAGHTLIPTHNTNKKIKTDDDWAFDMLLSPFNKLKSNELNKYSLQLSIYAILLEEVGLNVDYMFLCHIPRGDEECKIYKCKDLRAELKNYLSNSMLLTEDIKDEENNKYEVIW